MERRLPGLRNRARLRGDQGREEEEVEQEATVEAERTGSRFFLFAPALPWRVRGKMVPALWLGRAAAD